MIHSDASRQQEVPRIRMPTWDATSQLKTSLCSWTAMLYCRAINPRQYSIAHTVAGIASGRLGVPIRTCPPWYLFASATGRRRHRMQGSTTQKLCVDSSLNDL